MKIKERRIWLIYFYFDTLINQRKTTRLFVTIFQFQSHLLYPYNSLSPNESYPKLYLFMENCRIWRNTATTFMACPDSLLHLFDMTSRILLVQSDARHFYLWRYWKTLREVGRVYFFKHSIHSNFDHCLPASCHHLKS